MHKHTAVLDKVKWCRSLHGQQPQHFTRSYKDALNPGITDITGAPVPTPHGIYVNDNIYLDVADPCCFEQANATSIEEVFILLGKSNLALLEQAP